MEDLKTVLPLGGQHAILKPEDTAPSPFTSGLIFWGHVASLSQVECSARYRKPPEAECCVVGKDPVEGVG